MSCLCLSTLNILEVASSPVLLSISLPCCESGGILGHQLNGPCTLPLVTEAMTVLSLEWLYSFTLKPLRGLYVYCWCACQPVKGLDSVTVSHRDMVSLSSLTSVLKQRPSKQSGHIWLQMFQPLRGQDSASVGRVIPRSVTHDIPLTHRVPTEAE